VVREEEEVSGGKVGGLNTALQRRSKVKYGLSMLI
jgi:hypothetical protein